MTELNPKLDIGIRQFVGENDRSSDFSLGTNVILLETANTSWGNELVLNREE